MGRVICSSAAVVSGISTGRCHGGGRLVNCDSIVGPLTAIQRSRLSFPAARATRVNGSQNQGPTSAPSARAVSSCSSGLGFARVSFASSLSSGTSESNRARSNAFYLSPSPTARNHWKSGPSAGRTNQRDSEQAPLGSTAARPAPEPACDVTKHLQMSDRRGAALQRSRTATNANRWISRGYSRRSWVSLFSSVECLNDG